MKKTIALILAFMMCVSLLSACGGGGAAETKPAETAPATEPPTTPPATEPPATPTSAPKSAPTEETSGTFTYTYENDVLTISGNGVLDEAMMEECGARKDVLDTKKGVQVVLEPGVTKIGDRAFLNCFNMVSVTIPESVTEIGFAAFGACLSLTSVTFPEGVTKIGENSFSACTGLTSVTIPMSAAKIDSGAFSGCGLTDVTIPNPDTVIAKDAFDEGVTINLAG